MMNQTTTKKGPETYIRPRIKYLDLEQMIAASLGQLPSDDWVNDDF